MRLATIIIPISTLFLCGACGSSSDTTTAPSSSLAPLTVPSMVPQSGAATTVVPSTAVSPSGAEEVLARISLRSAERCDPASGTDSLVVEHPADLAGVLRQLTVIIDGRQVSPPLESGRTISTVTGVRCDDAAHTAVVVAIDRDGSTRSRAFAVLMPR